MEKIKPLSIRLNPDKELDRKALEAWNSIPEGDRGRIVKQLLVKYAANDIDLGDMSAEVEGDILYSAAFEKRVKEIVGQMFPGSMAYVPADRHMEDPKPVSAGLAAGKGKASGKKPAAEAMDQEPDLNESVEGGSESADADLDLLSFYDSMS